MSLLDTDACHKPLTSFLLKWLETCQFLTRSQPDLFSKFEKAIHYLSSNSNKWTTMIIGRHSKNIGLLGIDYQTVRQLKSFQF